MFSVIVAMDIFYITCDEEAHWKHWKISAIPGKVRPVAIQGNTINLPIVSRSHNMVLGESNCRLFGVLDEHYLGTRNSPTLS